MSTLEVSTAAPLASTPGSSPGQAPLRPLWGELGGRPSLSRRWLWKGYVARSAVTLLTSQWKTGKTTLLSVLLDRFGSGGSLAGQTVQPARVIVLSEEPIDQWRGRHERFQAWPNVGLECRPFRTTPSAAQWHWLIDEMCRLREEQDVDLVVIDSLAMFLPRGSENNVDRMLDALRPLEKLTESGAGLLLLHHPKKGRSQSGQAARGSGALCSYADVLMEMHHVARNRLDDRRRRLLAWSRHDETPHELVLELADDGRDYRVLAAQDEEFERASEQLVAVLRMTDRKLTRREILAAWPDRQPHEATLYRWLERSVERRLILQEGTGRRNDPFRYWLPGRDLPWLPDPLDVLGLGPP